MLLHIFLCLKKLPTGTVSVFVKSDCFSTVICSNFGILQYRVVLATSGHLRFGAKVAPRGRWPPDIGTFKDSSLYIAKVADQSRWPFAEGSGRGR